MYLTMMLTVDVGDRGGNFNMGVVLDNEFVPIVEANFVGLTEKCGRIEELENNSPTITTSMAKKIVAKKVTAKKVAPKAKSMKGKKMC